MGTHVECTLEEEQADFWPNRLINEIIIRRLIELKIENGETLAFIDLRTAFDMVIWEILKLHVPKHLVKKRVLNTVKGNNMKWKHGDSLSPL